MRRSSLGRAAAQPPIDVFNQLLVAATAAMLTRASCRTTQASWEALHAAKVAHEVAAIRHLERRGRPRGDAGGTSFPLVG